MTSCGKKLVSECMVMGKMTKDRGKRAEASVGRGNETNYKRKTLANKESGVTHHIGGSGVPVGLADNGRIKDNPDEDDIRTAHWTGQVSSFPLPSTSDTAT
jgi:hypothetical protein